MGLIGYSPKSIQFDRRLGKVRSIQFDRRLGRVRSSSVKVSSLISKFYFLDQPPLICNNVVFVDWPSIFGWIKLYNDLLHVYCESL